MKAYRVLAFEAATDRLCIVACAGGRVASLETEPARDETQRVFEHAARLLAEVGSGFRSLDFVAFGRGPGSFTGVRVAAAAAQSLAFAAAIPVCRVSSLAILAATAGRELEVTSVAVCLDARMGRAYVAHYTLEAGRGPAVEFADALVAPGSFTLPGSLPFVAVGEGWQAYPAMLARHGSRLIAHQPGVRPAARDLLGLATRDFEAGEAVPATEALPEYLGQEPVAEPRGKEK
jgi:tRNA threonylcarbamoyladenosine biosynthesis protein TsaB